MVAASPTRASGRLSACSARPSFRASRVALEAAALPVDAQAGVAGKLVAVAVHPVETDGLGDKEHAEDDLHGRSLENEEPTDHDQAERERERGFDPDPQQT